MKRRKRWLLLTVLAALSFSSSCGDSHATDGSGEAAESPLREEESRTTDTKSLSFKNMNEKLSFLEQYMEMPSDVYDAEYHIIYNDNSQGRVPGPPDWEIRAALKVDKDSIALWTDGMKKILPHQVDREWWEDLKTPSFTWEIQGDAERFKRPGSQSYLVTCPEDGIILKFVSTMYAPQIPEPDSGAEAVPFQLPEGFPDPEALTSAAAEALGYDDSAIPYIELAQIIREPSADGKISGVVCLRAMFFDSPIYGIPVLAVCEEGSINIRVMCGGSYEEEFFLADITGDGMEELIANHCIGVTGGAGSYQSAVYKLARGGLPVSRLGSGRFLDRLFENPDYISNASMDTHFFLYLSEGFVCTVENFDADLHKSFTHSSLKDSPYFDSEGNLTDEGREYNQAALLATDPFFFVFRPVDADGDGIYEIMTAQYSYLWDRSDSLGTAYTILKWSNAAESLFITDAGFAAFGKDGMDYEDNWYKNGNERPENERSLVCEKIEGMDFSVRYNPVAPSFLGSEEDRKYRDAFYQMVTGKRKALCRKPDSLEYQEKDYRHILKVFSLEEEIFRTQVLEQDSGYDYMDYDGDGHPELIVRYQGIYVFRYAPQEDQVYLYLHLGSNAHLMGPGQIYWYVPSIDNTGQGTYCYSFEDRNGHRENVVFGTKARWDSLSEDLEYFYYVKAEGYQDIEVSKKVWERLLGRFKEAVAKAPAPMTFEEIFKH